MRYAFPQFLILNSQFLIERGLRLISVMAGSAVCGRLIRGGIVEPTVTMAAQSFKIKN